MAVTRRRTKQVVPLIVEPHPEGYTGFPFITLLQFRHEHLLTIIDNSDEKQIKSYILDLCGPKNVDEKLILSVAQYWYDNNRDKHPLSIEFARRDLTPVSALIYHTFDTEFISRVIGPLPKFAMDSNIKVKKRRRKNISKSITTKNIISFPSSSD